jgi:hypothetical protein
MLEGEYPFKAYEVDYVVDYSSDPDVQSAILDFCKRRDDCVAILGFPYATNAEMDKDYRINKMNVSLPMAFLYSGEYFEVYDPYTKKNIELPNSFEAMSCHLYVDTFMDFTTPVAGIVGGSVRDPIKGLSYVPTKYDAEQLTDLQINPLVKTPNGLLFYPTQLTAYKKSSYLQRQYVVKTLNRIKKDLWPQLYELLERKATADVIEEARRKIEYYLDQLKVDKPKYAVLNDYSVNISFAEGVLDVNIELRFVDIIDRINVNLILKKS